MGQGNGWVSSPPVAFAVGLLVVDDAVAMPAVQALKELSAIIHDVPLRGPGWYAVTWLGDKFPESPSFSHVVGTRISAALANQAAPEKQAGIAQLVDHRNDASPRLRKRLDSFSVYREILWVRSKPPLGQSQAALTGHAVPRPHPSTKPFPTLTASHSTSRLPSQRPRLFSLSK